MKKEEKTKVAYEVITALSTAPDSQIDKSITQRFKEMIGKPWDFLKTETRHIIDDCVFGGLASDFGMQTMIILYEVYLDGQPEDFNDENNPWRKNK